MQKSLSSSLSSKALSQSFTHPPQESVLENGIRVVTEYIPYVRSICLGIWVTSGSTDDSPSRRGITHFLEHMFFKGTAHRDAFQIAHSLESLGGKLNAFTSKDVTCYYARILDEHLPVAIDVLSDILTNSIFPPEEIEKEKRVVIEEIRNVQDSPDELVHELFVQSLYEAHPIGVSTLGEEQTVSRLCRDDLLKHKERFYNTQNMVIAAAGNIEHEKMVEVTLANFHFPEPSAPSHNQSIPVPTLKIKQAKKDISQVHLCLGIQACPYRAPQRYPLLVLDTLLGTGMSSRLFQNIREKLGLAYSVYSYLQLFQQTGLFGVYLATDPAKLTKAVELILDEFVSIKKKGLAKDELFFTKSQLKGNLVLNLENTSNWMIRIAEQEIYDGQLHLLDETIAAIDAVSEEQIQEVAHWLFNPERLCLTLVEPQQVDEEKTEQDLMELLSNSSK